MKLSLIIFYLFLSTIINATIINIPSDQISIQVGIDVAVNTDTVLVQTGTYYENINFNGKLITVGSWFLTTQDTTYISSTIIDGNSSGNVATFDNIEDSTAVLCGFTITNGNNYYGGGIYCNGASPSFENLIISGNTSTGQGGGISCRENSNPNLEDLIISGNYSNDAGGIYLHNSSPSIQDIAITDNSSTGTCGGLICYANSSPTLNNVKISGNVSNGTGGGINCRDNSNPNLTDVIISSNSSDYGGGIYLYNSSPILQDVEITDNSSTSSGGGICCWENSNPILNGVIITGNTADYRGGGICCDESSPILENLTITDNSASIDGGGIYCGDYSSPDIDNVIVSNNSAENNGGGIYCERYSNPSLNNVTITGNFTNIFDGGGIHLHNSSPSLQNVIISNNSAYDDGGGIFCYLNSNPIIKNVTITSNTADNRGGGFYCYNSIPSFENITIFGNSATIYGGGIYCSSANPVIINSILWNNLPDEIYLNSSSVAATYSDIEDGWAGTGNIDSDPIFVLPTNNNYNLKYTSPCIDTGDSLSSFDPDGSRVDMGAYFFDKSIGAPTINTVLDVPDDQGRSVIVTWQRSLWDQASSEIPITGYNLWEKYPYELDRDCIVTNDINKAIENEDTFFQREDTTWIHIDYIAAMQWEEYSAHAVTNQDSTTVGDYSSYFFVSAHTIRPTVYCNSSVDSGYSMDNIAPNETEVTITQNSNSIGLNWNEVECGTFQGNSYPEINGIWYKIYAGDFPDFICDESHLIDTVTNFNYDYILTGERKKFFKVVVSDQS